MGNKTNLNITEVGIINNLVVQEKSLCALTRRITN